MTPTFLPATPAHTEAIVALMREFYLIEHLRFDERLARRAVQQLVDDPRTGTLYLIVIDDAVQGYVVLAWNFSLEFGGRYAWIDELYVREPWRGRGIGGVALAFVEAECVRRGIRAVRLEVQPENARAREWYLRSGYVDSRRFLLTKWTAR